MTNPQRGAVEFRAVRKDYGAFTAIPKLDLTIEPGQLVTLLGPSGCGKTTTLRMLAGLETPTDGTIRIGGQDVTRLPANRRDVTMVFQSYALFPHMSVIDNIAYGLESDGTRPARAREMAQAGLELVGLSGLGDRLPSELSGGQQQRVAVARALVLEPQVLLLDEPLDLDARSRRVRTEIRELQQRLGFTAFMSPTIRMRRWRVRPMGGRTAERRTARHASFMKARPRIHRGFHRRGNVIDVRCWS